MNKVKDLFKARWMSSLVFLILLFLITGIADHNFLTYSNIINCFNTATMYTLLAIGIAFVIMTGEIDVSIGATLGLTAAMTGLIAQSGGSIGKMLLICVAVGAAVGVVNGVGVAFFGVPSLIFTLGTNHIYILKETGEIVDNCMKRPQRLFREEQLSVDECVDYLSRAVAILKERNPEVKVIFTVSPIRYAKYGFHGSQLSKATLLLAVDKLVSASSESISYFPAYEIMNDELRDYRFYQPDMLHPSEQAVDYIYELFAETYFSADTKEMVREWQPIKAALAHRPFNPDSEEHKAFLAKVSAQKDAFLAKWKRSAVN